MPRFQEPPGLNGPTTEDLSCLVSPEQSNEIVGHDFVAHYPQHWNLPPRKRAITVGIALLRNGRCETTSEELQERQRIPVLRLMTQLYATPQFEAIGFDAKHRNKWH